MQHDVQTLIAFKEIYDRYRDFFHTDEACATKTELSQFHDLVEYMLKIEMEEADKQQSEEYEDGQEDNRSTS
jgi:hypothetical protein